ncbi:sugar-binding transcriptional regulator [uncultured Microbacterium sp.]|uniref:sugar-binding transcriptional regulator n=1 Tax=uncultured Microbacterium sp. TaxID=191216 RepID=UPI002634A21C|nr:sugar-binding domain-containing protein [uncultured Microbacterium sp.]
MIVTSASEETRHAEVVQDALTAAHLYYVQGHTMAAIATELRTSRSTVSRLLSYARSEGIVDIRIRSPLDAPRLIEDAVRRRYGIVAHVAPVSEHASEAERLDRTATTAAHVLSGLVRSSQVIGVAWGSTTAAVSMHLIPTRTHGSVIVQLNGSGNTRTTGLLYASEILQRFARAYGAAVQQFPVPAFFDDPATRRAFWRESSTRRILDLQERMNLVVFSVGAAESGIPSHVYAAGYLDAADQAQLETTGVVGDVGTVFYRADGSTDGIALNDRATGPDFATLRRVPHRVCVIAGTAKLRGLRGALAADLVTELVIDEATARALLDDTE